VSYYSVPIPSYRGGKQTGGRGGILTDICIAAEGAIGGTAQKIGGPLDKEGMIGKQFTTEGSIGGTVQNLMGGKSKTSN
jgi:hypothetical protein